MSSLNPRLGTAVRPEKVSRWGSLSLQSNRYAFFVLAAMLVPAYIATYLADGIGHYRDDAVYVSTAKALAEGRGYRLVSLPHDPVQTKYPVLLPAILAAVWKVAPAFPANALALKLVPLASTILWLVFVWILLIHEVSRDSRAAQWITLVVAASPMTIFLAGTVLADSIFALLTVITLLFLRRIEKGEAVPHTAYLAALTASLAFLAKTAGLSLLAAGCIALLLQRRFRDFAVFVVSTIVLCSPWLLWLLAGESPAIVDPYNSFQNYSGWNVVTGFTLPEKVAIISTNALLLIMSPTSLLGLSPDVVGLAACILFAFLVATGFVVGGRGQLTVIHLFVVAHGLLLLMWAWPPARFVAVMLPFLLMFAFRGISSIFGASSKWVSVLGCAILIVVLTGSATAQFKFTRQSEVPSMHFDGQFAWADFEMAMERVRLTTPENAILLGNLDPTFYLYTGRKSIRGFQADPFGLFYSAEKLSPIGTLADLNRVIDSHRVTHIVETPDGFFSEGPWLRRLFEEFRVQVPGAVRRDIQLPGGYRIIEVDRRVLSASITTNMR